MFKAHRGKSAGHFFRAHKTKHGRVIAVHAKRGLKVKKPKAVSPATIKAAKVAPYKSVGPHVPASYKASKKPKPYKPVKPKL